MKHKNLLTAASSHVFIQARGALKKELLQHLKRTRAMRHSRHHTQNNSYHESGNTRVSMSPEAPILDAN